MAMAAELVLSVPASDTSPPLLTRPPQQDFPSPGFVGDAGRHDGLTVEVVCLPDHFRCAEVDAHVDRHLVFR